MGGGSDGGDCDCGGDCGGGCGDFDDDEEDEEEVVLRLGCFDFDFGMLHKSQGISTTHKGEEVKYFCGSCLCTSLGRDARAPTNQRAQ